MGIAGIRRVAKRTGLVWMISLHIIFDRGVRVAAIIRLSEDQLVQDKDVFHFMPSDPRRHNTVTEESTGELRPALVRKSSPNLNDRTLRCQTTLEPQLGNSQCSFITGILISHCMSRSTTCQLRKAKVRLNITTGIYCFTE